MSSLLGTATEADGDGNAAAEAAHMAAAQPPVAASASPPNGREKAVRDGVQRGPTPRTLSQLTEHCFSRPGADGRPAYHEDPDRDFRLWLRDQLGIDDLKLLNLGPRLQFAKLLRGTRPGALYDYHSHADASAASEARAEGGTAPPAASAAG